MSYRPVMRVATHELPADLTLKEPYERQGLRPYSDSS